MKILLPVDGSEFSESAIPVAQSIARRRAAEIILLRVVDPFTKVTGVPSLAVRLVEHEQVEAGPYLQALEQLLEGLPVRALRPLGSPRETITKTALEEQCDLIVMASHGRSGLRRWLLGSVAENVLRQSPCPVLLIRPELAPVNEAGFKNVILPVDGSEPSRAVMEKLIPYLADDAQVTVMQASDLDYSEHSMIMDSSTREHYVATLLEEMSQVQWPGHELDYQVVDGPAASAILSMAEEQHCDLIAMSTHGRTGFRRFVLGSVTERVERHAACPVLAFPPVRSAKGQEPGA